MSGGGQSAGDGQSSGRSDNGGGKNGEGKNGGGQRNGEENGGGGNNGGKNSGQGTGEGGPSTAEKVVMAISVAVTVALFAFVIWQAMSTPTGVAPQATVVGTQSMADGSVEVAVRLTNPSGVGLQIATVEVNCTSPPPEIQFQNVPADDYQVGYVVCPNGTTDPGASVSWWIEA